MNKDELNKYNETGYDLMTKAESKLQAGFFKSLMSSKEERLEKALDVYKQALDNFKLAKNCLVKRDRMFKR